MLPKGARFPKLWGRPPVEVVYGEPLRFAAVEKEDCLSHERLRDVADEIMASIGRVSGQTYVHEYATRSGDGWEGPPQGSPRGG